ncbi:hypothetical protein GQ43DRAFT_471108 [Delitschia confertaspora ATCC 74209]|uniref:Uncharacterized protein n=1 Tax=Delitschia confertaspora ATCC 74209 TaxID=1513339 RepID=A0A9P4JN79_9PLEO|nr:hypothetical protein GQ43DRAFT_471108 [Delitschia confertaspora ATCC 74209]
MTDKTIEEFMKAEQAAFENHLNTAAKTNNPPTVQVLKTIQTGRVSAMQRVENVKTNKTAEIALASESEKKVLEEENRRLDTDIKGHEHDITEAKYADNPDAHQEEMNAKVKKVESKVVEEMRHGEQGI